MLFSMLVSPLPPSLLDTYNLSTSSLGCKALCMVINFLILWSIFKFFSGPLQEKSRVSYEGDSLGIYTFDKVPVIEFYLE